MILVVLLVSFLIPFRTALVFYKQNTSQIQAFLPIEKGETFQIIWKHSIHLTDVVEKFRVTEKHEFEEYEMIYEHFGIGMPSNAGKGETFVYENGKYHIKDMERVFPTINIRNGRTVSEHRLVWGENGEKMVWFNEYFEPGALFTMKVDRLNLWQYLKGVKIHE